MAAAFFYINNYRKEDREIILEEEQSRHIVQVLRMKAGENLNLTDGQGNLLHCAIAEAHKKHCVVVVNSSKFTEPAEAKVTIAISLLKNTSRIEWFLEKATELGVNRIIPLLCERTEKQKFRFDRMQGICISAMLQSQQCWLPGLQEPVPFGDVVRQDEKDTGRFIAHCAEGDKKNFSQVRKSGLKHIKLLVGPEGDFTTGEIDLAIQQHFIPVTLGPNRLRTETAAVAAAVLACSFRQQNSF